MNSQVVSPSGVTRSSCPENETCTSGACVSDAVAEETLPDYLPEEIFGGGNATGGGACFDTIPCFEGATQPDLDLDTCVLAEVVSDDLNVGIRLPIGTDGHCTNRDCWIPIDRAPSRSRRQSTVRSSRRRVVGARARTLAEERYNRRDRGSARRGSRPRRLPAAPRGPPRGSNRDRLEKEQT